MINSLQEYLKNSKKTNLIFDFDETIIKLVLPWDKSTDRIKDKLLKLDPKSLEQYQQNEISFSVLQNAYVLKFGEKALKLFLKNNLLFEKEDLKEYLRNEEMINLIKNLKDYEMLIWSSNMKSTIERILNELQILDKFSKIVSREDVKLLKPYVEGFERLYDGKPRANYLFIGDSKSDKEAASKAGIDFYLEDYFNVQGKYW